MKHLGDSTFCGIISFGLAILKEAVKQISLFLRIAITLKSHEGEDNPLFAASGQLKNMYDHLSLELIFRSWSPPRMTTASECGAPRPSSDNPPPPTADRAPCTATGRCNNGDH